MTRTPLALAALILATLFAGPALAADVPVESAARAPATIDVDKHPGKALFAGHCAMCHEGGMPKAPHREFLEMMAPPAILHALNDGAMKQQASSLKRRERRQIVEYLTKTDLAKYKPLPGPKMCTGAAARFDRARPVIPAGWGYDTRRFIPGDAAGLTAETVPGLKLKWAFGFPSALRARSQPVVAMGAIFVGSQDGSVYALDLATGCARWVHHGAAEVRTAIVVEPGDGAHPRVFFGDFQGRAYALDALTGRELWRQRVDDHANATITGTPLLHGDTLYVPVSSLEVVTAADPNYACCTFRGLVAALDIKDGRIKWKHFTVENPPVESGRTVVGTARLGPSGAPVWGSPAFDDKRGVIYHGSGENYMTPADGNSDALFAVDAATGARRWRFQLTSNDAWNSTCAMKDHPNCPLEKGPDFDLSASPMRVDLGDGKDIVVVGQKSGMVHGVDPDTGKPVWSQRVGRGGIQGGIHFGMAADGATVFVGITDLLMQSDGSDSPDPGVPGLHAVDARTGRILWSAIAPNSCNGKTYCDPGISAAVTAIPGVVFAGHLDGMLRAYDSRTGAILWETGTAKDFATVNSIPAHGGSISGPGVTVSDGYVVVNSGYGFSYHMPGNVLLVFAPSGS